MLPFLRSNVLGNLWVYGGELRLDWDSPSTPSIPRVLPSCPTWPSPPPTWWCGCGGSTLGSPTPPPGGPPTSWGGCGWGRSAAAGPQREGCGWSSRRRAATGKNTAGSSPGHRPLSPAGRVWGARAEEEDTEMSREGPLAHALDGIWRLGSLPTGPCLLPAVDWPAPAGLPTLTTHTHTHTHTHNTHTHTYINLNGVGAFFSFEKISFPFFLF